MDGMYPGMTGLMITKTINNFWEKNFKDFIPEAHNLKHSYKDRWVRFHALPESKRYPESEQEYCEILRRYNLLLHKLCGEQAKLILVLTEYSESAISTKLDPELTNLFPETEFWRSVDQSEEDYKCYWHLHISEVHFTGTEFNHLFRLVADNQITNVMVISISEQIVFHPYDGGMDIMLPSIEKRNQLKDQHTDWLSAHPEGF